MSTNYYLAPEFNDPIPEPRVQRRSKLLELLAVVAVIAILIALFLPAVRSGSRPAARRALCVNNLKQIGLALHSYEQAYHVLPPAYTVDANGRPLHSWRTLILPYLEEGSLYGMIDLSKSWNDPANAKARETDLSVFRCPEMHGPTNATTYLASVGPSGCLNPKRGRRLAEITDGLASTIAVVETGKENSVVWMAPVDADESLFTSLGPNPKLNHAGGMNACFVDGSVRFLRAKTPPVVLRALFSISGHEKLSADEW